VSSFAQFCQALVPSDKRLGYQRVTPASYARPKCASYFSDAAVADFYRSEWQSSPFLRLSSQWFGRSRCGRDNLSSTPCGVILFFLAAIERQWRETRMARKTAQQQKRWQFRKSWTPFGNNIPSCGFEHLA